MINRFRRAFAAFRNPPTPTPPASMPVGDMRQYESLGIEDGVDYRLPVIIPDFVRRDPQYDALVKSLTENLAVMPQNQAATYNSDFGNPYRNAADLPFFPVNEDPLREWTWQTRERVLTNTHAAYHRNPLANATVQFTADFVIGDGFNLSCKNKEVEAVLEEFINEPDNAIRKYERQAVIDLQVDGELVLRFFKGKDGAVVAVPQRPWELEYIDTEEGFFRRPKSYRFQRYLTHGDSPTAGSQTKFEDVPAKDIQFVAINDHSYELRGRPDLYRILAWLRADKEFVEDIARQNRWRNALLWHVRVMNATPATIASVLSRWRRPPSPGSAYVSTDKEEVLPLTNPTPGNSDTDGRSIRLMVILGMRLPEYFFGDGQNANMATATKQELPALTKFEAFQQIMIEQLWTPIFKRVLQAAIDAGRLPEEVDECDSNGEPVYEPEQDEEAPDERQPEQPPTMFDIQKTAQASMNGKAPAGMSGKPPAGMSGKPPPKELKKTIPTIEAFEVTYEPVVSQDLAALANMLNVAVEKGWASGQTAAEKLGFDATVERKRMEKEEQKTLTDVKQGKIPIPPDMLPRPEGETEAPPQRP